MSPGKAGIHSSHYYTALDASYNMLKLTIKASPESELAASAMSVFYPYRSVAYENGDGSIMPCIGRTCYEPFTDVEELRKIIRIKSAN